MANPDEVIRAAEEVAEILESRGVGAVVIGAVALAAHGYVRFTEDLDLEQRKGTGPFIDAHHATQSKSDKHPRNCQRALRLTCATRTSFVPCDPRRFRWSIFERQA